MGHFHHLRTRRNQTRICKKSSSNICDRYSFFRARYQFGQRRPASGILRTFPQFGQPQEYIAGNRLLVPAGRVGP